MSIIVEVLDSLLAFVPVNEQRPLYKFFRAIGLTRLANWLAGKKQAAESTK